MKVNEEEVVAVDKGGDQLGIEPAFTVDM